MLCSSANESTGTGFPVPPLVQQESPLSDQRESGQHALADINNHPVIISITNTLVPDIPENETPPSQLPSEQPLQGKQQTHRPLHMQGTQHSQSPLQMQGPNQSNSVNSSNDSSSSSELEQHQEKQIMPHKQQKGNSYIDITEFLNLPQVEAAKRLSIPPSTLSKRWKEAVNKRKWPWRTVCKIDKEIMTLLHNVPQGDATQMPTEVQNRLAYLLRKRQQELKPVTVRL